MPKKALVRSIEIWNHIQRSTEFGAVVSNAALDWNRVVERKNEIIHKFTSGKEPRLKKLGVDLVRGHARFTSPDSIQVGDNEYTAERFLIGTGSKSANPPIEGIEYAITSQEILDVTELPESLAIIGGGVISLEFAHVFANAGVKVTMVVRGSTLLSSQDAETSQIIQEITESRGINVMTHAETKRITKGSGGHVIHAQLDGKEIEIAADLVLNATGRAPNVDDLGLEQAGIVYTAKGIQVNEYFQTTSPKVYAAGDVIGGLMLTPVAAYEAKAAIRNALRGNVETADYSGVPHAIFTLPPVASVGLSEEKANKKGIEYQTHKAYLKHSGVAIILGEEEGYIKILSEKTTGRIIGFHMVGVHADEIIHAMAIAIKANLTIQALSEVTNVHPTISEMLILMAAEAAK
jgi:pyruvate/2-oxoglutarate dehydrogenase complex dihydrolipoamide dehydrogenase (E3) component